MYHSKKHINLLRKALWEKVFDQPQITPNVNAYDQIRKEIHRNTGYHLSRDTIRNFLEGRHRPAPQTLDIYSTFLLNGNEDQPFTFQDFVNSLKDEKLLNADENKNQLFKWIIPAVFLLFILSWIQCDSLLEVRPENNHTQFFNRFYNSNLDELNHMGWHLYDDSINLEIWNPEKYRNSGYLTLETHLGDSWLSHLDFEPKIVNILRKPIDCGSCCEVQVKLVDFNPFQRYQQAGFFLFSEEKPYPSYRYGMVMFGKPQVVIRNGEYSNWNLFNLHHIDPLYDIIDGKVINPIDSIVLAVKMDQDQYIFRYKKNNDNWVILSDWNNTFPPLQYIGLYACQGRPDIPTPVRPVAPVIPAHFEYVSVLPCVAGKQ